MVRSPRLTWATLRVLKVLMDDPTSKRFGLEIGRAARLPSGTVYPLLMRLEQAGVLTSEWEDLDPKAAGRPRRRLYQLSSEGVEIGRRALQDARRDLTPGRGRAPGLRPSGGASE